MVLLTVPPIYMYLPKTSWIMPVKYFCPRSSHQNDQVSGDFFVFENLKHNSKKQMLKGQKRVFLVFCSGVGGRGVFGFWFCLANAEKPNRNYRNCQWLQSSERTTAHVQCQWF